MTSTGAFGEDPFAEGPWAAFGSSSSEATPITITSAIAPMIVDGDTVRDANGNLVDATDPIDEEVAFYLTTVATHFFGDPNVGNGVVKVHTYTERSLVDVMDYARRALRPMTERGDISNVVVTPTPQMRGGTALNLYVVNYRKTNAVRR